jgi:hypothetical protein
MAPLESSQLEFFRPLGGCKPAASDRQPNSKWKKKGETSLSSGKRLARENLQLMLYLNLCKLMEMFPRQPEKLTLYMQQSLLEVPTSEDEEEPEPPVPPTP